MGLCRRLDLLLRLWRTCSCGGLCYFLPLWKILPLRRTTLLSAAAGDCSDGRRKRSRHTRTSLAQSPFSAQSSFSIIFPVVWPSADLVTPSPLSQHNSLSPRRYLLLKLIFPGRNSKQTVCHSSPSKGNSGHNSPKVEILPIIRTVAAMNESRDALYGATFRHAQCFMTTLLHQHAHICVYVFILIENSAGIIIVQY